MTSTFKRTERKYVLTPEESKKMLALLGEKMDRDIFDTGNGYYVYNIYYDNETNAVIRQSNQKPKYKEKLRVRSYEIPNEDDNVFVEIKKKIFGVVNKRRISIPIKCVDDFFENGTVPDLCDPVEKQIANELLYFQKVYKTKPTLFLSYHRYAFSGKENKDFRVTLDFEVTTRRFDLDLKKGSYGESLIGKNCIMEVKFVDVMPVWLVDFFKENNILTRSISKYGTEYARFRKSQLEEIINV